MSEPGTTCGVLVIEDIARSVLRKAFHFYHDEDTLVLEIGEQSAGIAYSASQVSESPADLTAIGLNFLFDVQELWIGELCVSVPFRLKGLGRQLVQAAEMIAHETGIEVVNVLPLRSSESFWLKLGSSSTDTRQGFCHTLAQRRSARHVSDIKRTRIDECNFTISTWLAVDSLLG